MNKKSLLLAVLLSTLLFAGVAGTTLVNLGKANPFYKYHYDINKGSVTPDENTEPPTISIFSPENDAVYGADIVSLSLNVSVGDSSTASSCILEWIYCNLDWQPNITAVYTPTRDPLGNYIPPRITEFSGTINLTGIPDGNHTLMVYAIESGRYELSVDKVSLWDVYHYYNTFTITGSSLVSFSVDTTPPVVSVFSPENLTCYSPEASLNFTVSEKCSRMVYSLDGQENVTIAGNTTLTNLPYGEHNVTVYATDMMGHIGASETIYFTIEEPFPTMPVATASLTSAIIVSAGLLFYFKKRKG